MRAEQIASTGYESRIIVTTPADYMMMNLPAAIFDAVVGKVAGILAEKIVAEQGQAIIALVDQNAVATMTMAESAAAINDTLKKKYAEKPVYIEKTKEKIYQRGIFGGMTRIA